MARSPARPSRAGRGGAPGTHPKPGVPRSSDPGAPRRAGGGSPLGPAAAPGDDTRLREALRLWSRIQATLLVHFFGRADGSLDLERIAEAFLLFSAGALRIPVVARRGVGEPDSAYYFAFAEFALLSLEHDIDPQVWAAVLPHLVWTQEVYAHMQRPPGPGPHRFHEYAPRGRERSFSLAVAAEARERCRGLTSPAELAALHGRHCREAFGDLQPAASPAAPAPPAQPVWTALRHVRSRRPRGACGERSSRLASQALSWVSLKSNQSGSSRPSGTPSPTA
ncbi:MAG: hypothetical protein IPK67_01610 [Planctomycetes bacterium]|nr:hypothetical protein [Planctomycetota bacterium]